MQKSIAFVFILILFFSGGIKAQITINSTDIAAIGDTVPRAIDTLGTFAAGPAGANQTWNFNSAIDHDLVETKVISPTSTPYAGNFPGSNLVMTNDNVNYLYFNLNTDSLVLNGLAGDLLGNGNNISTEFTPDVTLNHFPMNYGNTASDYYFFDETTSGNGFDILFGFSVDKIRLQHTGVTTDTVDAWGTVTTPYGTYTALRNKHVEVSTDVIMYKLFSFSPWATFGSFSGTALSYSWTAKESGLAVAELAYDSLGLPDRLTYFREPPSADFSLASAALGLVNFTDLSSGKVDTWSWDFGDASPLVNTQNPTHIYTVNGTYTACLKVTNSAGISSHCDTVTIIDAVGFEEGFTLQVAVFPNPAQEQVWLQVPAEYAGQTIKCRIIDLQGKAQWAGEVKLSGNGQGSIPLAGIAKGIYMYEIGIGNVKGKLVVE